MSQIDIEVATRATHDGTHDAVGINQRGKPDAPYIHRRLTLFTLDYQPLQRAPPPRVESIIHFYPLRNNSHLGRRLSGARAVPQGSPVPLIGRTEREPRDPVPVPHHPRVQPAPQRQQNRVRHVPPHLSTKHDVSTIAK